MMKSKLASALLLAATAGFGLTGCSDTAKTESQTTTSGPGGTTTETHTDKVQTSGSNPPAPGSSAPATPNP